MRRIKRYLTQARQSGQTRESRRFIQSVTLPMALLAAIVSAEFALLAGADALTPASAVPVVWQAVALSGLVAAYMHHFGRP